MGVGVGYLRQSQPNSLDNDLACICNALNTCQHTVTQVRVGAGSECMCYVCKYVRGEVRVGPDLW